ncbi:hypothetical protein D3C75_1346080 [compost metagenome]
MPMIFTLSGAQALSSTRIELSSRVWHSGMSSWVFFAAMIPAIRATANTSPLGWPSLWISFKVSGRMRTQAWA